MVALAGLRSLPLLALEAERFLTVDVEMGGNAD